MAARGEKPMALDILEKDVDVVLSRQQRADVSHKHEVRTAGVLDRLGHFWVGGVDQIAHLAADRLLPIGQGLDVGVNTWIGGVRDDPATDIARFPT